MGQVPRYLFLFLLFSTFIVEQAQSYVPTLTPKGTPIRWKGPVKLRIAGNSSNSSYFAPGPFFDSVVAGLNRWKAASDNRVEFDYWQGTDAKKYPTTNEFDGLSTISFASNSKHPPQLSTHILGVTQVWYQPDTGEIWDVDITLNDRDFIFTNDPKNTSGYGGGELLNHGGKNQVYIENVITHELGHALGLSHSGGLQSTMLFMESPEQAYLGCDDKIGIQALYGAPNTRGSLTGFVKNELGAAVFGAHIVAISQNRGVVLATALTDSSGRYTLQALEPGPYFLAAEPFYAGPTALPPYYSEINTNFCRNKTPFGRSFLTEADGNQLQTFEVESGKTTQATELTVHCNDSTENLGGAFVVTSSVPELRGVTAIPLFEAGGRQKGTFGILDRMGSSTEGPSYLLSGISGHLEVHAMAYSL